MIDLIHERRLTIKEAATLMKVTERTVTRWFSLGLERQRIGGRVYTSQEALQRFSVDETERPRTTARQRRRPDSHQRKVKEELARRYGI